MQLDKARIVGRRVVVGRPNQTGHIVHGMPLNLHAQIIVHDEPAELCHRHG
jgi:hypothetical protein